MYRFQWNFEILLHTKYQRTLYIVGNFRSRSRSQRRKNLEIFIEKLVSGWKLKKLCTDFNETMGYCYICGTEEPYRFWEIFAKVNFTAAEKLWNFRKKIGFRMLTQKVMYRFQWNFGILLHTRYRRTLLILGNFCSRSRSQQRKNLEIFGEILLKFFGCFACVPCNHTWSDHFFILHEANRYTATRLLHPCAYRFLKFPKWRPFWILAAIFMASLYLGNYWTDFDETWHTCRPKY